VKKYTIDNFLILVGIHATQEDLKKVLDYIDYRKERIEKLLCMTSSGRASYALLRSIAKEVQIKGVRTEGIFVMSRDQPFLEKTHERIEYVCGAGYVDCGILLVSDLPLHKLMEPIYEEIGFVQSDRDELGANAQLLEKFKKALTTNPNLVMYDARTVQFI